MPNSQPWRDEHIRELFRIFDEIEEEPERGVRELDVLNDPNNWYDPFKPKEPKCQSTIS